MGTPDRSVAIRLGTTGKADVTQAFDEIASSGEGSARRFKVAYERAGEDVTAAIQRQASAAAKLAAIVPQTAMQMQVNAAAGSNTRFGGGYAASAGERNGLGEGSAKRSAAAFRELIAAEEQLEVRTRALVASIDPAFVAQQRFNAEIGEARALVSAGAISLDQYVAKLRIEQAALDGATNAQNRAANSAGAHRAAMQGLSFQAQDAFTQISMGTNPLSVLAIQGGQAAGQMANLEGKVGAVASFFIGPWGLAITGGLLLLGALTDKMMKASEAADKKKGTIKDLTKSINDLNEATSQQIKSEQAVQAETLRTAGTLRQKALDARTATIEQLKLARAALAQREATADPTNADGGIDVATAAAERRTAKLSALLKVQEDDLAKAQVTFRQAEIPAIQRRVSEAFDKSAAATGRYERAVDALNDRYAKGKVSQASYEAQLSKLTATKERETEAAKKGGSVSTAAADADARVASATNDVQRATANLAKVRADSRAELKAGTITQAEYTARVADAQRAVYGARDAAKAHTAAVKDAAEAQRELASDLTEVVRRLDPTRAAAEQYAETLAKIAKLRGAGKLTDADAGIYAMRAGQEEAERAAKVRSDNIKKIFGINGDPLADVMSGYETEQQARIEALSEASERQQTEQEQGVRKLSSLYTSLFSSRTKTLWQEFEQRGKQVFADLLAKWTLGQMGNVNGGGLLGSIKKLFGAGTSLAGGITAPESIGLLAPAPTFGPVSLPKLASGTEYWSGGMALLGEGGVEAAYLPRGTRVSPASETRRAMGVGQVGHASVEIVPTKYFDAIVRHATAPAIADGMVTAATQGAVGGAEMARTGAAKARSRSLVR